MLSKATGPRLSRILLLALLVLAVLSTAGCSAAPSRGWSGPLVSDNVLYVGTLQGKILALDLTTAVPSEGEPPIPLWDPKVVAKQSGGSNLSCGRVNNPSGVYGTPVANNGRVYIGAYSGTVVWITTDGLAVSDPPFETDGTIVGSVVIDGETLFVGSSDGTLYAIDLNLKEKWRFNTKGEIWSTPVVSDGVVYVGSADHNLYAIDTESGNEIWRFETEAAVMSTPLVDNGTVYIGGCDRKFYALKAATGEERLAARSGASPITRDYDSVFEGAKNWFWTQALAYNGDIWVGNLDHKIYVLNAENVAEEVHDAYKTGGMVYSPPVALNGVVAVGSQDGKIYAINPDTWDVTVYAIDAKTDEVVEAPDKPKNPLAPILAPMFADQANGVLYFHAQDGTHTLYAFKLSTKEVLWSFRTDKISD
jgi:eukaryotic-like serine/threonine-protein kinase